MMDMKMHEAALKNIREMERSLRVEVKLTHDEVDRIVINRLIQIRSSNMGAGTPMDHFDKVLVHFLGDDDFQKYVIDKEEIEY